MNIRIDRLIENLLSVKSVLIQYIKVIRLLIFFYKYPITSHMKTLLILTTTLLIACTSHSEIFGIGHRVFTDDTQGRNALCADAEIPEQVEISLFRRYTNQFISYTRHEFFIQIKVYDRLIDSAIWVSISENSSETDFYHKDTFQVPNLINETPTITITITEIGYRYNTMELYHSHSYKLDQSIKRILLLN